jgi:ABC-type nitrate/sulfonate/bicarbonate transport system substrate-binding protein
MKLRVAIPDLISPSYFPAIAAVEMGCFRQQGFDAELSLLYPVTRTYEDLREGKLDFVGGAAHAALYAFKDWRGCKLLCALAQHMYWFLVLHSKFKPAKGDLASVRNLRIGAAPGPVDGLQEMLKAAGIDPAKDVTIGPVPGTASPSASFGLMAAKALQEGRIDGFWANGMGAEVAVRGGYGTLVLDARRDGTSLAKGFTFPALVTSEKIVRQNPAAAHAASNAVKHAQQMLKEDPDRATAVGEKRFPPEEAGLIAELVRRDAPFYDPAISPRAVGSMNRFAASLGLLSKEPAYEEVVWKG